jgi:hypothetical protein
MFAGTIVGYSSTVDGAVGIAPADLPPYTAVVKWDGGFNSYYSIGWVW